MGQHIVYVHWKKMKHTARLQQFFNMDGRVDENIPRNIRRAFAFHQRIAA